MEGYFLVFCKYEVWSQGPEEVSGYFLVRAGTFYDACEKLRIKLDNAWCFENFTVE